MWKTTKYQSTKMRALSWLVLMSSVLLSASMITFGGDETVLGSAVTDASDLVFEPKKLHELKITIDGAVFDGMRRAQIRDWREAQTLVFDDFPQLSRVGIKIRGFHEEDRDGFYKHPNFNFDFARFLADQRLSGLSRMVMESWSSDDNSLLAQRLGLTLFAKFGQPAARSAHAKVFINGQYIGVYVIMDHIRKDMISRFFPDSSGNLYKLENTFLPNESRFYFDGFALDQENPDDPDSYMPYPFRGVSGSNPDGTDLVSLILAVNRPTSAEVRAEMNSLFNLNNLIDYLAADMSLTDPDGLISYVNRPPIYFQNNCYFYHDPRTDKFFIVTDHDLDSSFDSFDPLSADRSLIDGWNLMRITKWLLDQGDLLTQFVQRVFAFVDTVYKPNDIIQQIDEMAALIRQAVRDDTTKPLTDAQWEERLNRLRRYVRDREAYLRRQFSIP